MSRSPVYQTIRSTPRAEPRGPAIVWYSSEIQVWHAVRRAEGSALCGQTIIGDAWHCYANAPTTLGGATICDACAATARAPAADPAADLAAATTKRMLATGGRKGKRK